MLALDPDYLDVAGALQLLFGDEEVGVFDLKYLQRRPSLTNGGDLPEEKMNEAKWTPMVVVRAADNSPAVKAMERRANRGTNDSALYLERNLD